jgi:very-short-patch-repair endonuclease
VGPDRAIASLAADQHGVISFPQLRGIGLGKEAVYKRVGAGRLHPIHQGVYAVGHSALTPDGWRMAAVLACGPGAVLSHRSAAALWGLRVDRRRVIDVTAPNRRGRIPKGIRAHRDGALMGADRTVLNGIPCTNVSRVLLDLAGEVPMWELRKVVAEAEVLRVLDRAALRKLIQRSRGRRGVARLRLILDELDPQTKRTRSELERMFLRMCTRAGLPRPEVNVSLSVEGRHLKPDFLWRDVGLIIETDSHRYHDTGSAFESDRRREQRLQLAGWQVSRCTWAQVEHEPRDLAARIQGLLAQANLRRRA